MGDTRTRWMDAQFDGVLAAVLRTGVLISATVVAFGGVIYLRDHAFLRPEYGVFIGEPESLRSVRGIVAGAGMLRGPELIQLGVLLLIATPVARVVFSVIGFARQRDSLYVGVTLVVLLLLAYSLTTG